MGERRSEGEQVLAGVAQLPGGGELLAACATRDDAQLVGGAVRDLMLGRTPRELDVVVADGARALADELAAILGSSVSPSEHERFGTALVCWEGGRIDLATRRAERYEAPGALPQVREGSITEDLDRRDFTVNAIAVTLGGRARGDMRSAAHAREDLVAGRLRVLHDESFRDDPTRLMRLARYRARLGFAIEAHTARLASQAVDAHALDTVSGARSGAELRLALGERDPLQALGALDELGLLAALHPRLRLNGELAARALALLPQDGRPDLLLLAAVGLALVLRAGEQPGAELRALLDRLEFPARERDRAVDAALAAVRLGGALDRTSGAAALCALIGDAPPEGVALAGAQGSEEPASRWLSDLRHVGLRIDGDDLIAAGIPEGPEIGRRLEEVLHARLDGELPDEHAAQLRAALELVGF